MKRGYMSYITNLIQYFYFLLVFLGVFGFSFHAREALATVLNGRYN